MSGIPWNMVVSLVIGVIAIIVIAMIWNAFWLWWQSGRRWECC